MIERIEGHQSEYKSSNTAKEDDQAADGCALVGEKLETVGDWVYVQNADDDAYSNTEDHCECRETLRVWGHVEDKCKYEAGYHAD